MTTATYLTILASLVIGIYTALAVMIVSFLAMIFRWKTGKRRGHVVRLLLATAVIPSLIGIQQVARWIDRLLQGGLFGVRS